MKYPAISSLKSKVVQVAMASLIAISGSIASTNASAALTAVAAVPTNWRTQYYVATTTRNASAAVFFTGITAACGGPHQSLAIGANNANAAADTKRFYETITAAKLAKAKVVIYYDDVSCVIESFGLMEGN